MRRVMSVEILSTAAQLLACVAGYEKIAFQKACNGRMTLKVPYAPFLPRDAMLALYDTFKVLHQYIASLLKCDFLDLDAHCQKLSGGARSSTQARHSD